MKLFIYSGLIFVVFFSTQAFPASPNGLCLVITRGEGSGGYAQGFISNGALHSAAHVLEMGVVRVFCSTPEGFIDVTDKLDKNVEYNPKYQFSNNPLVQSLNSPYDYGRIKLHKKVVSDFSIDSFSSAGEKVSMDERRGIGENPWFRAKVLINREELERTYPNIDPKKAILGTQVEQLKEDVAPVSVESLGSGNPNVLATTIEWETKDTTLFLDDTLPTTFGDSGSPLLQINKNGDLLVSGVASTVGEFLPELSTGPQAIYTLAMNFTGADLQLNTRRSTDMSYELEACRSLLK